MHVPTTLKINGLSLVVRPGDAALSPPESVVESMGSVLKAVFGQHRQLKHCNAAKELIARRSGPHPLHYDSLIKSEHCSTSTPSHSDQA